MPPKKTVNKTPEPTAPAPTAPAPAPDPHWWSALRRDYTKGVSHTFLLHGNVGDYVRDNVELRTYLAYGLMGSSRVVVFYNRAQGFTFVPGEVGSQHRERFLQACGMSQSQQQGASALAALTGSSAPQQVTLPREPAAAFPKIDAALRQSEIPLAVIITHAAAIVPMNGFAQQSPDDRMNLIFAREWAQDPSVGANHLLVMVQENLSDIHSDLRASGSRVTVLEVPLPNEAERLAYIRLLERGTESLPGMELEEGYSAEEMARGTSGLARVHLEDIRLLARDQGGRVTRALVRDRKREIISAEFDEVLEVLEPEQGFESVGGYDYVKEWTRRNVIQPVRTGNRQRCPMGVLFCGPSGTGKTRLAMAIAAECGLNCVKLNLAKVLGMYVGQSERNLERALACILSMEPTLVIIDEVDQSVPQRGGQGDSGVGSRLFGRMLDFMSVPAHRGRIIFLGLTNRPDNLDAAFKREGRLDKKVPILCPDASERAAILQVHARRYLGAELDQPCIDQIVAASDGWTGAELEALCVIAGEEWSDNADGLTREDCVVSALAFYRPATQDIELMTMLALAEVNDTRLLPERYRPQLADRAALAQRIAETKATTQPQARGERAL